MQPSSSKKVREMYDDTADSYAEMMDAEIDLPVYSDILGRLRDRIASTPGALIDTACGSGHMLTLYHEHYEQSRPLLGVDLSPRMVAISEERLGQSAQIIVSDMRDLSMVDAGSAIAVISFFAIHHLDADGIRVALHEWYRVLRPGGELVIAAWEGSGAIDYGDESDVIALRYQSDELASWTREAGFSITRSSVEPVEGMEMDAVYIEGNKDAT